jgi:hypothetical protein
VDTDGSNACVLIAALAESSRPSASAASYPALAEASRPAMRCAASIA